MTTIPFSANYRRYPPELAELLMRISEALGVIRGARVLPAVADQLRASAKAGTVHYSNLIEGNELPFVEAERAARGELDESTRAKIELVNYVAALDLIDERLAVGALALTPGFLKQLHATAMRGLGRKGDAHFKPHHEGEWRDGIALVVDRISGQVMYNAPPPEEVPGRMQGTFEWLDRKLSDKDEPPFVLAGVMHYAITDVHPFADGNGRAARLMQTALLMKAEVLPGRMFSFDGFYARDRDAYYGALRSVRLNTFNQESWLAYFLRGLAEEYERVAATVADLGSLMSAASDPPLQLTPGQQRGLVALHIAGHREFSRRQYEDAAGVARTAAGDDLRALVRHGVLTTRGSTSATRYAFPGGSRSSPDAKHRGRPPKWNEARIERELQEYLAGRTTWPPWDEFRASGHADVYSAASRNGGIARWRRILGM